MYSEAGSEIDSDEDDLHLSGSAVYNSRRDPAPGVNLPGMNQLVQQQQGMLLKIIQQQETLQENQTQYAERFDAIESTLSKMSQCRSAEQNSKQQERSRLPKGLGVSYIWLIATVVSIFSPLENFIYLVCKLQNQVW